MYTLGIPKRDYRRTTQVLDYESQPSIPYNANLQDDGFYILTFPEAGDEDDFRNIVEKLKNEGIRVIGADSQLTEKQIIKLANLVEIESPDENNLIDDLKMALEKNRQMFNNSIFKAVSDVIRNYEMVGDEERMLDLPEKNITEQKLRKLIQDELKRIS